MSRPARGAQRPRARHVVHERRRHPAAHRRRAPAPHPPGPARRDDHRRDRAGLRDAARQPDRARASSSSRSRKGDEPHDDLLRVHLLDDPYRAMLPEGHPLADDESVELTDLAHEDWVAAMGGNGFCRDDTVDLCRRAGFTPRFVAHAVEFPAAQAYVAAGIGVGLVPVLALGTVHRGVVGPPAAARARAAPRLDRDPTDERGDGDRRRDDRRPAPRVGRALPAYRRARRPRTTPSSPRPERCGSAAGAPAPSVDSGDRRSY